MEPSKNAKRCSFVLLLLFAALAACAFFPINSYADDGDRVVWVSKTGSKYHYIQDCSGMKNPIETTLSNALAMGKQPCSNCVHDSGGSSSSEGTSGSADSNPRISPFSDIYQNTDHSQDISWLYENGITSGWPAGGGLIEFRPFDTVKRCDMAAFLYRMAGTPAYEPTEEDMGAFSDVTQTSDHAKEIWWLRSKGITTGFSDGTFRGYDTIKRCDMAAFLKRLAHQLGGDTNGVAINPFTDVSTTTDHRDDILWMVSSEISEGWRMADGTREYRPYDTVKRCDMAAFLHRLDNWCSKNYD